MSSGLCFVSGQADAQMLPRPTVTTAIINRALSTISDETAKDITTGLVCSASRQLLYRSRKYYFVIISVLENVCNFCKASTGHKCIFPVKTANANMNFKAGLWIIVRQPWSKKKKKKHDSFYKNINQHNCYEMLLKLQISILEWFLKDNLL